MAKITINYNKYPKFPRDCKTMAKIIVPSIIEKHQLVTVNIIENGNGLDLYGRKGKVYGQSSPAQGRIDLFLNEIYDHNRSNEANRVKFLKVLIHECYHLKLGFSRGILLGMNKVTFRELQEFYVDNLAFKALRSISSFGIDITKEPFNIKEESFKNMVSEEEAIWIGKMIMKFNQLDLKGKAELNNIFKSTIMKASNILEIEMEDYFNKGYGFVDNSDSWKRAKDHEKET